MEKIQKMLDTLKSQKSVQNWGLQLVPVPSSIECTVLGAAQIFSED